MDEWILSSREISLRSTINLVSIILQCRDREIDSLGDISTISDRLPCDIDRISHDSDLSRSYLSDPIYGTSRRDIDRSLRTIDDPILTEKSRPTLQGLLRREFIENHNRTTTILDRVRIDRCDGKVLSHFDGSRLSIHHHDLLRIDDAPRDCFRDEVDIRIDTPYCYLRLDEDDRLRDSKVENKKKK